MAQCYDRAFKLTVGGDTVAEMSGDPDSALRVRFKVQARTTQAPNNAQIIVSNLSDAMAGKLLSSIQQKAKVTLEAGYVGGSGLIFTGDAWYGIKGRESPTDTTLQIFARDGGQAYDYSTVNTSLAKGSTPKDHFEAFVKSMSRFGVTAGYTPDLSSPSYPRGVSFFGMAKDHLRTLAASQGMTWSIQNGQVQMVPTDGYVPGAPFVLNSNTGLVGYPTQMPDSIMARSLLNPAFNCGSGNLVNIDQADIQKAALSPAFTSDAANAATQSTIAVDGQYRIIYIEITGDSRGNDWYSDVTCTPRNSAAFALPADKTLNLDSRN